jgi:Acyl-CoA carboxylase epsilon subunit
MTRPPTVPPTDPASPEATLPDAVPSDAVPSEAVPTGAAPSGAAPTGAALFEIVSGGATAEEIAALTAVLATMAAASRRNVVPARGPTAMAIWAERSRLVRRPLAHAPGAWRASARPS